MFETIEEYILNLFKLPESELKAKWEAVFHEMAVHTRKRKPEELLLKTRPNELPEILAYRLANYEPITYGSMNKALDDVFRIVNSINYSVKVDDRTLTFIKKNIFYNFSLDLFLQKIVLKRMIEDPNGFLVWMPAGLGLTDGSIKVEPVPYLLYSCDYVYSDKNIFIFKAPETSTYNNNGEQGIGKVYWLFTKNEIFKVYQNGPNESEDWASVMFYKHSLNDFPLTVLGGDMNAEMFYESFFAPYLAFGNQAIRQFSDWQAIMVTSGFPYIEHFVTECEVTAHVNKEAIGLNDNNSEQKYSVSTELKPFAKSPHGTIMRPVSEDKSTMSLTGTLPYDIPSIRFISPDVSIAKYSGESWEKLIELAEDALQQSTTYAQDSGKKVELNSEGKYSMITKLGNNYFDNIYLKSLQIISGYFKNSGIDMTVVINKPASFNVKTESMLIDQITTLKEKNAPSMFLSEATVDLAKKMFSGNDLSKKIFDIISTYDVLFIYSPAEKENILMSNNVDKKVYSISIYIYSILLQIANEKSSDVFLAMDNKTIYEEFLKRLDLILPKATIQTDPNGNAI